MRKFLRYPLAGIILLLALNPKLFSQIETRYVAPEAIISAKHYSKISKAELVVMPAFDVQELTDEDAKRERMSVPFRFGKEFKVDMGIGNSGTWYELENGDRLWALRIRSKGAHSINLVFDRFRLAEGAELYLYNVDNGVIDGSYTSALNNPSRMLGTGLVQGDEVILELTEPKGVAGGSDLHIGKVVHAYKNMFSSSEKGGSYIDVNCPQGSGWEKNSDAVVCIVKGLESFSGTLINDQRNDGTPYILTAFHCLTNQYPGPDYELTDQEKAATGAWVFYFQYRKIECNGAITYKNLHYGSDGFIAAWGHTDFALVVMHGKPTHSGVTYAGWSRETGSTSSTVSIHHPSGNPQKISLDYHSPVFGTHLDFPANHFWHAAWDDGITSFGSSGSALFNSNKQVIGQLSYGSEAENDYGRFDLSWNGPTPFDPQKSLKYWLDPDNTNTMSLNSTCNTIPAAFIAGPDLMCSSEQKTFKLVNAPLGRAITWTSSPSNLVTPSSYTGDTIFNVQAIWGASGEVNITASFHDYGSDTQRSFSKAVWVGKPSQPVIHVPSEPINCQYNAMVWAEATPNDASYSWQVFNGTIIIQDGAELLFKPDCLVPIRGKHWHSTLQVQASNQCGASSVITREVDITNNNLVNPTIIISPNPATTEVEVDMGDDPIQELAAKSSTSENTGSTLIVYNAYGATIYTGRTSGKKMKFNVLGWQKGLYHVVITHGVNKSSSSFIVK